MVMIRMITWDGSSKVDDTIEDAESIWKVKEVNAEKKKMWIEKVDIPESLKAGKKTTVRMLNWDGEEKVGHKETDAYNRTWETIDIRNGKKFIQCRDKLPEPKPEPEKPKKEPFENLNKEIKKKIEKKETKVIEPKKEDKKEEKKTEKKPEKKKAPAKKKSTKKK
jgi:hypothetical protein